jgi:glycosyltransferase involved in cell wall biosynthesis
MLLSDPSKRESIGKKGRQYAEEKWGADVLAKKVAKFYKHVITQKTSLTSYTNTRIGSAKSTV